MASEPGERSTEALGLRFNKAFAVYSSAQTNKTASLLSCSILSIVIVLVAIILRVVKDVVGGAFQMTVSAAVVVQLL